MAEEFRGPVHFGRELPDGGVVIANENAAMAVTTRIDGNHADVRVGGSGEGGDIRLYSSTDSIDPTIHIDGERGDIVLFGADCADHFELADGEAPEPGTVMTLDELGRVRAAHQCYDRRVVGVVSGAGGLRPGVVLGAGTASGVRAVRIAVAGRVCARFDPSEGRVAPGDLLTTSDRAGHVMRAVDPVRGWGAVVGKALSGATADADLVEMLVALR